MNLPQLAKKILVVDDDPGIRYLIWKTLQMRGFSVSLACSSNDAEARLKEEPFGMLVTDHDMPRETGLNFVRRLYGAVDESDEDGLTRIPIVMVSGEVDSDHVHAVQQAGIRAMVQKPFRPTAFAELIETVLNHEVSDDFIYLRTFN